MDADFMLFRRISIYVIVHGMDKASLLHGECLFEAESEQGIR